MIYGLYVKATDTFMAEVEAYDSVAPIIIKDTVEVAFRYDLDGRFVGFSIPNFKELAEELWDDREGPPKESTL